MNKKISNQILVGCTIFFIANSQIWADEITLLPKAGISYKFIDFKYDSVYVLETLKPGLGSRNSSFSFNTALPSYEFGLALSYGNYFASAGLEQTLASATASVSGDRFVPNSDNPNSFKEDWDVKRDDFTLSAGYAFPMGYKVFGGLKSGKTSLNVLDDISTFNLAGHGNFPSGLPNNLESNFSEKGLFIGGSKDFNFYGGRLSLGLAYADLDSKYSENGDYSSALIDLSKLGVANLVALRDFSFSGTAKGLSYSAAYTYPFNERLMLQGTLKHQQYSFSAKGNVNAAITKLEGGLDDLGRDRKSVV